VVSGRSNLVEHIALPEPLDKGAVVQKLLAVICVILVAVLAVLVIPHRSAIAAEGHTPMGFEGKILLVYGSKPEQGGTIVNASVEHLGNVDFLTGTYIDEPEYQWKRNLGVYIKLDQINAIVVYNNMDEYKRSKGVAAAPQK
jgi:hypothetical protein